MKIRQHCIQMLMLPILLLVSISVVQAATVTAKLDRNNVVVGETVTLTLQTSDTGQNLDTDLASLGADFEVLDQRTETQMSFVNGRKTAFVRLMVTLEPKHAGDLRIPALQFPGASSQPLQLHVSDAPQRAPGEPEPVFIELGLQPENGPYYVHAQVGLTVRIFYQANLTEAAINPPAPQQALVRLLDEVPYQAERNGAQYRVLERRYAIFPERSGKLEIPAMQLTGRLIEKPSDRLWQPTVRGRRLRVESDPVSLDIKPRPPQYTGDFWLPARRISLAQQISDTDRLHVGEPVTRTIIMDAVGLEENMLEEPHWPEVPNTRIYPDQPQGISRDDGEWVLGHKEFRYAIVPEKSGELVLPEIRLDWWDTAANQQRTAVLPEHRVQVLASELTASPAGTGSMLETVGTTPTTAVTTTQIASSKRVLGWQASTSVFAVLWLLTLYFYYRHGQFNRASKTDRDAIASAEAALLKKIQQACQTADASATRSVLSQWVRHYAPHGMRASMRDYAAGCGDEGLRHAIDGLDIAGFAGAETDPWKGDALWAAFKHYRGQQGETSKEDIGDAPDLYPG